MSGFYEAGFRQRPDDGIVDIAEANRLHAIRPDKGHGATTAAFAEAIAEDRPFSPGVIDGARATVCALKCYESIRGDQPVSIRPDEYGLTAERTGQGLRPAETHASQ